MAKRWVIEELDSDPVAANMSESTLILTINPNHEQPLDGGAFFRECTDYLLSKLDAILTVQQGKDVVGDYAALEPILASEINVSVRYEVGPRFHRQHVHIVLSALMHGRGNMMRVNCDKIRAFYNEQLGYTPYVNAERAKNPVFDLRRYILK